MKMFWSLFLALLFTVNGKAHAVALNASYISAFAIGPDDNSFLTRISFTTADDGVISGSYTYEGHDGLGLLTEVSIDSENILTATWSEDGASGKVRFAFEDDSFVYFVGSWTLVDTETVGGMWNGKRL